MNGVDGCIVLTPSLERAAWIDVIQAGAQGTRWTVQDEADGPPPSEGEGHLVAVIVSDAGAALALAPRNWAVITTGTVNAALAAESQFRTPPGQGVWVASRLLAQACLPPCGATRLTDENRRLWSGPVELLPGLKISPPAPDQDELARSDAGLALDLYATGIPAIGATADWPTSLFSFDRRNDANPTNPAIQDLTGPPRILVYGPYITLPPGVWRARIRFVVDSAAARHQYRLEWGDQGAFAEHRFKPGRAGFYELTIDFRWTAAAPSEVRLVLANGAIDGTLEFTGLTVIRIA